MKRAWYLGLADKCFGGGPAILIGDPDRIDRIAAFLDDPVFPPVSRGLRVVTGVFASRRVSAVSFGMGAPIATIVLHELAMLGIKKFLRIGTAMHFAPASAGEFLVSSAGIGFDGTSPRYGGGAGPHEADPDLLIALSESAAKFGLPVRNCLFATFDAFYRDMFGLDEEGMVCSSARRAELTEMRVGAADMETAALLSAASALDVNCATLCVGTVDGATGTKLDRSVFEVKEKQMFKIALSALCTSFAARKP